MPKQTSSSLIVQQVEIARIRRMATARPLDEVHVQNMLPSIRRYGLLQAVAVSPDGDGFVLVAGNHRYAAVSRLGLKSIDAVVLPAGMTEADLLALSLHENHIRKDEAVDELLDRIQALAEYDKCSLADAAKNAGVSPATLSKIQKIVKSLSPTALEFIRKHKIGNAIAYEVARRAKGEGQQLAWLKAHAEGRMSRDDIKKAAATPKTHAIKRLRIDLALGDIGVRLSVPNALGYEALLESIASLRSQIIKQQKREIAFELLPKVLK